MVMTAEFLILLCGLLNSALAVQVKTKNGDVEGETTTLFNGKNISVFLGVPYAAPPIGNYRFSPPQPVKSWNKTLQCKTKPHGCIQAVSDQEKKHLWYTSDLSESEDCLYLNVWTPTTSPSEKLAVMIWIFGGGFLAGSTSNPIYDGSVLASEQNVIVVTMNYRLSLFGFTYLNSSDVPGNAGLQDQIQAIRWVNDNIENFGGDLTKITLFGESAGAVSIGFHLTNLNIENLFQNAIMQSGSIDMTVMSTSEEQAVQRATELSRSVNCTSNNTQEVVSCLRSKSVDELLTNYRRVPDHFQLEFPPVRNGKEVPFSTSKILVPSHKRKNLLGGNIPRELSHSLNYTFPGKTLTDSVVISEEDLRENIDTGFKLSDRTLQDILLFQYKRHDGTYNKSQVRVEATEFFTDLAMICPQINFSKSWVSSSNKVYYYYFKHTPSVRTKEVLPKWIGATHGDEIPFVFGAPLNPQNGYTQYEKDLTKQIMSLWSNFAKTGNPNAADIKAPIWPQVEPEALFRYLEVDRQLAPRTYLKERECDFWTNVFPGLFTIQGQLNKVRKSDENKKC